MPGEVQATAELYLQGKIDQWYSLQGRPGVVFILNVTDPLLRREQVLMPPSGHWAEVSLELAI